MGGSDRRGASQEGSLVNANPAHPADPGGPLASWAEGLPTLGFGVVDRDDALLGELTGTRRICLMG